MLNWTTIYTTQHAVMKNSSQSQQRTAVVDYGLQAQCLSANLPLISRHLQFTEVAGDLRKVCEEIVTQTTPFFSFKATFHVAYKIMVCKPVRVLCLITMLFDALNFCSTRHSNIMRIKIASAIRLPFSANAP